MLACLVYRKRNIGDQGIPLVPPPAGGRQGDGTRSGHACGAERDGVGQGTPPHQPRRNRGRRPARVRHRYDSNVRLYSAAAPIAVAPYTVAKLRNPIRSLLEGL